MTTKTPGANKSRTAKRGTTKRGTTKSAGADTKKNAASASARTGSSTTKVDPRLAQRRIDVKRGEGRRRLRTLLALAAVTLATIGAIAFVNSSWLDVDEYQVLGDIKSDPDAIVAATGIAVGDPLLEVDLAGAETSVERLPWVLDATVNRDWGGLITVEISERSPVLALPTEEGFVLVDERGRQLETVDLPPAGFVPIAGISADGVVGQPAPPAAQSVVRLLGVVQPQLEDEIAQIVHDQGNLYLDLHNGGRALLGDDSTLEEKAISLETILANVDLRCLWEVDVRVPSAPAVTRIDAEGNPRATLTNLADCS